MAPRAGGWSAERSVGMTAGAACQLRKRAGPDSGFVRAWNRALDEAQCEAIDEIRTRGFGPVRRKSRTPSRPHHRHAHPVRRAARARVDVVTLVTLSTASGGPPAAARRPLPRDRCSRNRCNTVQYACNTARPLPLWSAPGPLLPRRLSPNYGAAPAAPLFCLIRAGGTLPRCWSRRDRTRRRRNNLGGNARECPGRRDRCRPPPAPLRGTRRPARGCRR